MSLTVALREEIRLRFPEVAMEFRDEEVDDGQGVVARIPCPSGAIGALVITTQDDYGHGDFKATVSFEGMMADVEFRPEDPVDDDYDYETASRAERDVNVITGCCNFLEDLFGDEIVVWVSADGRFGGWYRPELRVLRGPPAGAARAGTWSAIVPNWYQSQHP